MRRITIATAVLGVVATTLTTVGSTTAATGYDARAHLPGDRTCTKSASAGVTRRQLVLDNTRSAHRVQYKVVRHGDRYADPAVHVWVPAHASKSLTVSVPQRSTVSVRVRVPEMGREDLRLSATVAALRSCYVPTVDPKASLGGVSCQDGDSVARIVLDNRATSDDEVRYDVASSYGDASASLTVEPATSTNYYLTVPAGRSTEVRVTAAGRRVLSTEVAAVNCP
jgi:hypothetical protein